MNNEEIDVEAEVKSGGMKILSTVMDDDRHRLVVLE